MRTQRSFARSSTRTAPAPSPPASAAASPPCSARSSAGESPFTRRVTSRAAAAPRFLAPLLFHCATRSRSAAAARATHSAADLSSSSSLASSPSRALWLTVAAGGDRRKSTRTPCSASRAWMARPFLPTRKAISSSARSPHSSARPTRASVALESASSIAAAARATAPRAASSAAAPSAAAGETTTSALPPASSSATRAPPQRSSAASSARPRP